MTLFFINIQTITIFIQTVILSREGGDIGMLNTLVPQVL